MSAAVSLKDNGCPVMGSSPSGNTSTGAEFGVVEAKTSAKISKVYASTAEQLPNTTVSTKKDAQLEGVEKKKPDWVNRWNNVVWGLIFGLPAGLVGAGALLMQLAVAGLITAGLAWVGLGLICAAPVALILLLCCLAL